MRGQTDAKTIRGRRKQKQNSSVKAVLSNQGKAQNFDKEMERYRKQCQQRFIRKRINNPLNKVWYPNLYEDWQMPEKEARTREGI